MRQPASQGHNNYIATFGTAGTSIEATRPVSYKAIIYANRLDRRAARRADRALAREQRHLHHPEERVLGNRLQASHSEETYTAGR